jgi:membrane carboxypeptidase/penicillin-binding protein
VRAQPFGVRAVLDMKGHVVYRSVPQTQRVLSAETAFVTTTILEDVVAHGTGYPVRAYGVTFPVAGKTGTTNDEVDAWFVGYTPSLACGVWIGADRGGRLGLSGAAGALPVWATFMHEASRGRPVEEYVRPPGVEEVSIDASTGLRARGACPQIVRDYFVSATIPTEFCNVDHWSQSMAEDFADSTGVLDSTATEESFDEEESPDTSAP